jgi:hypothetical protein
MTIEVSCIINIITSCKKIEDPHDPMRQKAIDDELLCIQKHQRHIYIYWLTLVRDCLLEWYEKNQKRIYTKSKIYLQFFIW